ncbi:SLATT domain-containing protein [Saccharothrix sp. Mg75]|uniref:SLATT domain-containing protein n=1 Tax=Saccharothrix sp. Mg75 TaxID=3445357 RepID=UPI003EEE3EFD
MEQPTPAQPQPAQPQPAQPQPAGTRPAQPAGTQPAQPTPADPGARPAARSGLTPHELALDLLERVDGARSFGRTRKEGFRRRSVALKVSLLGMSATATIILGWQDLDFWTGLAFSLVALTTVFAALEPFFAWRSLWVLMEESQARFNRLRDDLAHYLAATPPAEVDPERVDEMYRRYQDVWQRQNERWMEFRRISDR